MSMNFCLQWGTDAMLSVYECTDCEIVWASLWDSACDDDCPECQIAYTPIHSWYVYEIMEKMNAPNEAVVQLL